MNTRMLQSVDSPVMRKLLGERVPMGRAGDPSELAGAIILFCSPGGRYITGVDVFVDGQSLPRFLVECDLRLTRMGF